jgi:hypothetical protein
MRPNREFWLSTVLFLLFESGVPRANTAQSQPAELWDSGGVVVTAASGNQFPMDAISDGTGGAIIVWDDNRVSQGIPDVFGQRINCDGAALWQVNGIPIANTPGALNGQPVSQGNAKLTSDGAGGAIVVWVQGTQVDMAGDIQNDIYAQRLNANGVLQWIQTGVPIATACFNNSTNVFDCINDKRNPQIISDGAGGAIITWDEVRDGFNFSVGSPG